MSILGINNRTENWKTARSFAPLLLDSYHRAELARKLGEDPSTSRGDVGLELFWKGMRDFVHGKNARAMTTECASAYGNLFGDLRSDIIRFNLIPAKQSIELPQASNYIPSEIVGLFNNLRNTEIDIVLETPSHLFIGEAKGEAGLGARGAYVLVHQLIRQYVMASILLKLNRSDKKGCLLLSRSGG